MAEDIVTRLREYEAITDNAYVINALIAAADEIERLRADRDRWRIDMGQLSAVLIALGVKLQEQADSSDA